MGSVTKCRDCGTTVDTSDPVCMCRDMQTKTISLPLEVAERFEAYDETDDDMAELRDRLRRKVPDMIF